MTSPWYQSNALLSHVNFILQFSDLPVLVIPDNRTSSSTLSLLYHRSDLRDIFWKFSRAFHKYLHRICKVFLLQNCQYYWKSLFEWQVTPFSWPRPLWYPAIWIGRFARIEILFIFANALRRKITFRKKSQMGGGIRSPNFFVFLVTIFWTKNTKIFSN